MLPKLLKTLLGSEPAIRLIFPIVADTLTERQELISALNTGAQEGMFDFRFNGPEFIVMQTCHRFTAPPAPTMEYNLAEFTRRSL